MRRVLPLLALLGASACTMVAAPTATPTPPPTATATAAPSATPAPSATATATPSITPSPSVTPTATITLTPSATPPPTHTPGPTTSFTLDNWQLVTLPASVSGGLRSPYVAILNQNQRSGPRVGTPQPGTDQQVLYYTPPGNRAGRIRILEMSASAVGDAVFPSPNGIGVAYFNQGGTGQQGGLYMLDLATGVSVRVVPLAQLAQRGFYSPPVWTPDGSRLAFTMATAYATDVFSIGRDGLSPRNMTQSGAYDVWPSFSPDGRYLLFASDRAICPSHDPADPATCAGAGQPPNGGHPYLLDLASNEVRQLADVWLTEPPRWLNGAQVVFASGDAANGGAERVLHIADVRRGTVTEVRPPRNPSPLMIAEAWSPNGDRVVFQLPQGDTTTVVLMSAAGQLLAATDALGFPRYGLAAAWSPDGTRIALGGNFGQCPFGSLVVDADLEAIGRSNPPPSMCEPAWSRDGNFVAFSGVNPSQRDGRADVFVADGRGLGITNLTGDLTGLMLLIGWVG